MLLPKPETKDFSELTTSSVSHVLGQHWSGLVVTSCQTHHEVMSDQPFDLELCGAVGYLFLRAPRWALVL